MAEHGHDDAHGHGHGHSHGYGHALHAHSHAPETFDRAFAVGVALNLLIVGLQFGYGLAAHSMALLADGVHNFGDVLGLLFAWAAAWAARRRPSRRRTYGWGRSTILASLLNAAILLAATGAIAVEAVRRLIAPGAVAGAVVMAVAAAAILANGVTALMFLRGRHDLNLRAAFLHMAGDAALSAGVLAAAGIIILTGWVRLDPLASLLIAAAIAWSSVGLLRESTNLALDAVPRGLDHAAVEACLAALPNVYEVHDLHIWGLSTTDVAATAHLVAQGAATIDVRQAAQALSDRFRIGHCTFQVETLSSAAACRLRPAEVV